MGEGSTLQLGAVWRVDRSRRRAPVRRARRRRRQQSVSRERAVHQQLVPPCRANAITSLRHQRCLHALCGREARFAPAKNASEASASRQPAGGPGHLLAILWRDRDRPELLQRLVGDPLRRARHPSRGSRPDREQRHAARDCLAREIFINRVDVEERPGPWGGWSGKAGDEREYG